MLFFCFHCSFRHRLCCLNQNTNKNICGKKSITIPDLRDQKVINSARKKTKSRSCSINLLNWHSSKNLLWCSLEFGAIKQCNWVQWQWCKSWCQSNTGKCDVCTVFSFHIVSLFTLLWTIQHHVRQSGVKTLSSFPLFL